MPYLFGGGLRGVLLPAHLDLRLAGAPLLSGDGVEDARDVASASEPSGLVFFSPEKILRGSVSL